MNGKSWTLLWLEEGKSGSASGEISPIVPSLRVCNEISSVVDRKGSYINKHWQEFQNSHPPRLQEADEGDSGAGRPTQANGRLDPRTDTEPPNTAGSGEHFYRRNIFWSFRNFSKKKKILSRIISLVRSFVLIMTPLERRLNVSWINKTKKILWGKNERNCSEKLKPNRTPSNYAR